jgi:flagellar hook-associated protein 3 FlgL
MIRLSTSLIYQQNMDSILNAQSKYQATGLQLSSGYKVNTPSDDPLAASQAVMVKQAQAENTQYSTARTFATNSLSENDNVLSSTTTTLQAAQTLLVQAGDSSLSDSDRSSIATELAGIKTQLLNLANSTDGNGNYIFAGYKNNTAPFTEDATTGAVTYNGGSDNITQQVNPTRNMTIGFTGNSVFMSLTADATAEPDGSASDANVFDALDTAIAALKTPSASQTSSTSYSDAIGKASRGVSNSLLNVASVQTVVGTQMSELDTLDTISSTESVNLSSQLSDLQDTDWTSAISTYSLQQVALQASYKTYSSMQTMSLFQLNS